MVLRRCDDLFQFFLLPRAAQRSSIRFGPLERDKN
jgi:hypothetical protein